MQSAVQFGQMAMEMELRILKTRQQQSATSRVGDEARTNKGMKHIRRTVAVTPSGCHGGYAGSGARGHLLSILRAQRSDSRGYHLG